MGPNLILLCPYRKRRLGPRHTQTEDQVNTQGRRELSASWREGSQGKPSLPTARSHTYSLQTVGK